MNAGPFATEAEARQAAGPLPEPGSWRGHNQRLIMGACHAAGVPLGSYDIQIIEWLAGWEPATCAVVAGLISRARQAGPR